EHDADRAGVPRGRQALPGLSQLVHPGSGESSLERDRGPLGAYRGGDAQQQTLPRATPVPSLPTEPAWRCRSDHDEMSARADMSASSPVGSMSVGAGTMAQILHGEVS